MAPSVVSVSPNSGSGFSQMFAFLYSDPNGYLDMPGAVVLINSTLSVTNACYLSYNRNSNTISLYSDSATTWYALPVGSAATVENSQCRLVGAGSSVVGSGADLTLTLNLTFKAAFAGAKTVYMYVSDSGGLESGTQSRGSWTVPAGNQAPSAVSVTPSSGSGLTQSFTFLYSDPNGYVDMPGAVVLINSALSVTNACYISYNRNSNTLSLYSDSATTWSWFTVGSAASIENSQCRLSGSGTSVSGSGTNLTLVLNLTFKTAFAGTKTIYMYVSDVGGLQSGTVARGTWSIPGPPSAVSVTPSSGTGSNQTFTFLYSDPNGYLEMPGAVVLINSALSVTNACYISYNRNSNTAPRRRELGLGLRQQSDAHAEPHLQARVQRKQDHIHVRFRHDGSRKRDTAPRHLDRPMRSFDQCAESLAS
jgi:hypothetical protein